MQTKLEKRLKHLNIPTPSQNLQDRCVATIPVTASPQTVGFQKVRRPLRLQRAVVAGAFLFASVAGIAFLSTRPSSDGKTISAGSTAFAQILQATSRVKFVHAKGRHISINIDQKGWYSSDWSRGEAWFDAERGLYTEEYGNELSSSSLQLAKGTSALSRTLLLSDGVSYDRSATSSTLRIQSKPEQWRRIQHNVAALLMGISATGTNTVAPIGFNEHAEPKLLSSTGSNWKGQAARLLIFEGQPSPENAAKGAPSVQAYFYTNPDTHLVIARQDFAVQNNHSPRLVSEIEFDYTRPAPTYFDPAPLKVGADVQVNEEKTPR